jgi:hypothetical protein
MVIDADPNEHAPAAAFWFGAVPEAGGDEEAALTAGGFRRFRARRFPDLPAGQETVAASP